ncbi:uncharacterized protein C2845_PM04G26610 [Panicum miliaceum]|uniref:Uncharacterized protein n=1 Tax=Panicum miliaceum TaxID=4540 RepID=A0A3L6QS71_PANMI|nr:uncharacterized protein C2845_PM04G26610 [Panicum miliaceum]
MEAQGAQRRAGETRGGGGGSNYIAKHVGIQNQVLKWLQHFSDRVEGRAKGAAAEVNGLLEETGAPELDMKTAVVAFDHLTRQRFTEHSSRDDALTITNDFSWLREFQGESLDSGADDLFEAQMLGLKQRFEKEEMDYLVSASREFEAMLEAALGAALSARMGGAVGERSTEADNAQEAELLASLQNPDINVHDIYSALVREGLLDAGDEILAVDPATSIRLG